MTMMLIAATPRTAIATLTSRKLQSSYHSATLSLKHHPEQAASITTRRRADISLFIVDGRYECCASLGYI